jgi:hypothetical protein
MHGNEAFDLLTRTKFFSEIFCKIFSPFLMWNVCALLLNRCPLFFFFWGGLQKLKRMICKLTHFTKFKTVFPVVAFVG